MLSPKLYNQLSKMDKTELVLLGARIDHMLRDQRIQTVFQEVAKLEKKKKLSDRVQENYKKLIKEIQFQRAVFIDDALEVLEILLDI